MLAADNVIDLMREAHFQFMDEAILATFTRVPSYFHSQSLTDVNCHERGCAGP